MTFCYRWWPSAHLCWRSTPLESAEDATGDEGEAEQGEHDDRADAQLGDRRLLLPSQVNLSSQRVLLLPGDKVFVNNITRVICIETIFYYFYTSLVKITSQSLISTHWENLIVPLDMSPPPVRGGGAVSFSWTRYFDKLQFILSLVISDIICNFYWLMTQHVERLRNSWRHPTRWCNTATAS